MNLDELMAVWKSQDAAPLHDVNKTLLHEALRQDEVRLQKARRRDRWFRYSSSAFVIGLMARFLTVMIQNHQRYVLTGWDYVIGIGGASAALLAGSVIYMGHRAQAQREQRFGESLRDQINRRLAQLDDAATGARRRRVLVFVLMGVICPIALVYLVMQIKHKSFSDVGWVPVALLILCVCSGAKSIRRSVQQAISRKRELETLLKEIDGQ
jgi:hypothetical protein